MVELPAELERELQLMEGSKVEMEAGEEKLSVRRSRYTLEELLAQCDYSQPIEDEEREWIDAPRGDGN